MIAIVYHLGAIGYRRFVLHVPRSMGPGWADLRAAGQALAHNLGRRDSGPRQGRLHVRGEDRILVSRLGNGPHGGDRLPAVEPDRQRQDPARFVHPRGRAAHGGEAVLAILAILVWHFYMVHIRRFNKSMFTGYLSLDAMEDEHPLELAAAGQEDSPSPDELRRRRSRYLPLFSSGALVLLFGIWLFVSFEETAILTIEPLEHPVVFSPMTTTTIVPLTTTTTEPTTTTDPLTTTVPTSGTVNVNWDGFGPLFQAKCTMCHGEDTQIGGLNLATFEGAVAGGEAGPGIVSGDPDASMIVTIQDAGGHPGQLDASELADLRAWVEAGARKGDPMSTALIPLLKGSVSPNGIPPAAVRFG